MQPCLCHVDPPHSATLLTATWQQRGRDQRAGAGGSDQARLVGKECWDENMKSRSVILWVQAPPGQSLASGPVANLAASPVTVRLMRRGASGWAVGNQSRNLANFRCPKGHLPGRQQLRRRFGEPKENRRDSRPWHVRRGWTSNLGGPCFPPDGTRGRGDPVKHLLRSLMGARAGGAENAPRQEAGFVRRGSERVGARESDGRIRAMMVGNGWHPDPAEQRRPVPGENFRRET
mgnify:CR=1 FL=1